MKTPIRFRRPLLTVLLMGLVCGLFAGPPALAEKRKKRRSTKPKQSVQSSGPRDYQSRNFLIHTDLAPDDAKELLNRLETMLSLISRYWNKRNQQMIECYIVEDLSKWPPNSIHPDGLKSIRSGAGVTPYKGVQFAGQPISGRAIVYASTNQGTPLHEAVHAYCFQNFGRTGPTWYSEGMAEMGSYWRAKDSSVALHPGVLEYLQETEPKSLNEIVNSNEATGDSWQNYAWRWALCHLLANNSNYQKRFRPLGIGMLTGQNVSFNRVYGNMANEISFEYLFFLKHLDQGYRVDLCSWNWKAKYRYPKRRQKIKSKIAADRGWQPSFVHLLKDRTYNVVTNGSWTLEKEGEKLGPAGNAEGLGALEAVLLHDYLLDEPFTLGDQTTFTAPADGKLLLRCKDAWNKLADNKGTITVQLSVVEERKP